MSEYLRLHVAELRRLAYIFTMSWCASPFATPSPHNIHVVRMCNYTLLQQPIVTSIKGVGKWSYIATGSENTHFRVSAVHVTALHEWC